LNYIFAIERNKNDPTVEQSALNTLRRVKEEIHWRKEEDGFPYQYDIIRSKNIDTSNKNKTVGVGVGCSDDDMPYQHHLEPTPEIRKNQTRCNLCGAMESYFYCSYCDWDACSKCYTSDLSCPVATNLSKNSISHPEIPPENNLNTSGRKPSARIASPTPHFPGPLFASSPHLLKPFSPIKQENDNHIHDNMSFSPYSKSNIFSSNNFMNKFSTENNPSVNLLTAPENLLTEFDLLSDFKRQNLNKFHHWRLSQSNKNFELCESYPPVICVPRDISDATVNLAASQRSSQRLPVLTWIHPSTGAALCRSSQPLIGITSALCPEDDLLLKAIRETALDTQVEIKEQDNIAKSLYELARTEHKLKTKETLNKTSTSNSDVTNENVSDINRSSFTSISVSDSPTINRYSILDAFSSKHDESNRSSNVDKNKASSRFRSISSDDEVSVQLL
jgi:hypothetical protein